MMCNIIRGSSNVCGEDDLTPELCVSKSKRRSEGSVPKLVPNMREDISKGHLSSSRLNTSIQTKLSWASILRNRELIVDSL